MDSSRASAFSGIVSIGLWVIVYSPQIWLNYREKTGEGLSLAFIAIWLAGDVTNLAGGILQSLLPTMNVLAVWYTLCDLILLYQVFYYRYKRARHPQLFLADPLPANLETEPLLSSSASTVEPKQPPKPTSLLSYVGMFAGAIIGLVVAYVLSGRDTGESRGKEEWNTTAQIVGYISAFLYLASRVPQISKNTETKCEGLSLSMFTFAVLGNLTYVASILLESLSWDHLKINASWLLGSGGTVFLDFIVLGQFVYYRNARNQTRVVEV